MKKIILPGLVAALAVSSVAKAELEVSGNVTTVTGYQHDNSGAGAANAAGGLTQGDFGLVVGGGNDHFRFMVDQVELDLENEFGDNIRARADVDFRDTVGTFVRGGANPVNLEQGYVTANLGIGNGMEFLVGKFNAPLGLESVDRHENVFSTYTPGFQFMVPKNLIGAKVYYEFNDNWSFDLGVVNSLNDGTTSAFAAGNSAVPSGLLRVGAVWGEEGNESFIHFAGAAGPETASNKNLDLFGAGWGNWSIGDFWDIGWDAYYRQTMTAAGTDQKAVSGQLYGVYQASDVWTVQLRAAAHWEISPAGVGVASTTGGFWNGSFEGMTYSGTLGTTYTITDDAKMKLEYRFDWADPTGATGTGQYHTGVAEFAYSF